MKFNEHRLALNMEPLPARRAIRIGERIYRNRQLLYILFHYVKKLAA